MVRLPQKKKSQLNQLVRTEEQLDELMAAGEAVVRVWESGDLAGAVRHLDHVIKEIKKEQEDS